jgi:hypothetical protein
MCGVVRSCKYNIVKGRDELRRLVVLERCQNYKYDPVCHLMEAARGQSGEGVELVLTVCVMAGVQGDFAHLIAYIKQTTNTTSPIAFEIDI